MDISAAISPSTRCIRSVKYSRYSQVYANILGGYDVVLRASGKTGLTQGTCLQLNSLFVYCKGRVAATATGV